MPNIIDILARALSLRQETALNSITPNRAGGIMYDTLLVLNQMQLEGGSLLISKVYASVSAMEADTTPTSDLTGRALKPGQLVVIVTSDSSSSDMGSEYRFNGPGSWTYVGKVGGLPLDTVPTQSSTKGITSGGVYTALAAMKAEGYKYMGLATPGSGGTAPGTPNQPVFYIAGPGSYPNFGSITVASGYLGFIKYSSGSWTVESVAVGKDYDAQISALDGQITQLEAKVDEFILKKVEHTIDQATFWEGMGYYKPGGTIAGPSNSSFHHSYKIELDANDKMVFANIYSNSSMLPIAFFDANGDFLSGISGDSVTGYHDYTAYIPPSAKYFAISEYSGYPATQYITYNSDSELLRTEDMVSVPQDAGDKTVFRSSAAARLMSNRSPWPIPVFPHFGAYKPNGKISGTGQTAYVYTDKIPVNNALRFIITADIHNVATSPAVFFDENENFLWGYTATETDATFDVAVPKGAKYVAFSVYNLSKNKWNCSIEYIRKTDVCYLSLNGDDSNDGLTADTPVRSFEKARSILDVNGILYILAGDYENSDFNLGLFRTVIGIGRVRFLQYDEKITSADPATGYSNTYVADLGLSNISTKFCWQHDIPDATTEITDSDRLPIHKGRTHRLPSTRIYRVNSIAEVEASTRPSWFYDNDTQKFYFSKVTDSDLSVNPIIISVAKATSASQRNDVCLRNLEFLYQSIALSGITGRLDNVSAGMCTGNGAFNMRDCKNVYLYHCEAFACYTTNGGDGFNTHTTMDNNNVSTFEGGVSEITMFDCYGHDNSDDGESCHEHCHIIQHGGLYEYNGSGCTPASNGNTEYYGVICRHNKAYDYVDVADECGFSCQGSLSVDGVTGYSSMICNGCISQDNGIGYRIVNDGSCVILQNSVADGNTIATLGTSYGTVRTYNLITV